MSDCDGEKFLLERYKYVLEQKRSLNSVSLQIVAIFQAGLILVTTGAFSLSASVRMHTADVRTVRLGLNALCGVLLVVSFFCLLLLFSGISAWSSYKREERDIEARYEIFSSAPLPPGSIWRWFETYIVLGICAVTASFILATEGLLAPLLK